MNILVTGATGRVGANLVNTLVKRGEPAKSMAFPGDPKKDKLDQIITSYPVRGCWIVVIAALTSSAAHISPTQGSTGIQLRNLPTKADNQLALDRGYSERTGATRGGTEDSARFGADGSIR